MPSKNVLAFILIAFTTATFAAGPQKQSTPIDRIEVVVNDDVITRQELEERTASVTKMLQRQKTMLPDSNVLQRQVLERMISEMLQDQFAKESGLRVDDAIEDALLLFRIELVQALGTNTVGEGGVGMA